MSALNFDVFCFDLFYFDGVGGCDRIIIGEHIKCTFNILTCLE